MTTATSRRLPQSPTPARRLSLADVTGKGSGLPNRYIVHGGEGTGKTSFAAHAPAPVFIQSRGETGLETLIDAGRLPQTPHFPECQTWEEILSAIDSLIYDEHTFKSLVIDTLNGVERLGHEHVCQMFFKNDWTDQGFMGYMRGYEVSLGPWRELLSKLDTLREQRKMAIVALCHTKVKTFKNPEGADYDRYQPDMHEKTWGLSHKWADAVLFLQYETFVDQKDSKKKGKATGSQTRMMMTERHAAFDAKNRMGLPLEINMGESGQEAWNNFKAALIEGRQNGKDGATNG